MRVYHEELYYTAKETGAILGITNRAALKIAREKLWLGKTPTGDPKELDGSFVYTIANDNEWGACYLQVYFTRKAILTLARERDIDEFDLVYKFKTDRVYMETKGFHVTNKII